MMTFAASCVALFLAQAAHAGTAQVPSLQGPALSELQAAAQDPAAAASQLDGSTLKVSGDGTVVVDSKRETYVRDVPPSRECDHTYAGTEGRMRPYQNCVNRPGRREFVEADVETVRVADRKAFTARRMGIGSLLGGGLGGLLGLFGALLGGVLGGPIGFAAVFGGVVLGAMAGSIIGEASANRTPDTFTRRKERSATPLF